MWLWSCHTNTHGKSAAVRTTQSRSFRWVAGLSTTHCELISQYPATQPMKSVIIFVQIYPLHLTRGLGQLQSSNSLWRPWVSCLYSVFYWCWLYEVKDTEEVLDINTNINTRIQVFYFILFFKIIGFSIFILFLTSGSEEYPLSWETSQSTHGGWLLYNLNYLKPLKLEGPEMMRNNYWLHDIRRHIQ